MPGTFAKKSTYRVKRNAPSRKSANPRNLKKTTTRGAYKRGAKKNFRVRREPFVETKALDTDTLMIEAGIAGNETAHGVRNTLLPLELQNQSAFNILPIFEYYKKSQGIEDYQVVGNSIYSKYLKTKLEFTLPYGDDTIRHPAEVFLVHGWITQPIGATAHTSPSDKNMTQGIFMNHINDQIQQYFNDRLDKLRFIGPSTSNVQILGYKKLKIPKRANLGLVPTLYESGMDDPIEGSLPMINATVQWRCMKKIQLTKGISQVNPGSGFTSEFRYPNNSWIPFMVVYSPTFQSFTANQPGAGNIYPPGIEPKISVRYNTKHYYSDS